MATVKIEAMGPRNSGKSFIVDKLIEVLASEGFAVIDSNDGHSVLAERRREYGKR